MIHMGFYRVGQNGVMLDALEKGVEAGCIYGAEYVELRAEDTMLTSIRYSDGRVDNLNTKAQSGVACRVLHDGAWGFTCGAPEDVETMVKEACDLAKAASVHRKEKIRMEAVTPCTDTWMRHYEMPPHEVSLEEKISRLDTLHNLIKSYDKRIKAVSINYTDSHGFKYLVTNEGTEITQEGGHVYNFCWVTGKEKGTLTAARDMAASTEEGFEYFKKETEQKIADRIGKRVILQLEGKRPRKGVFPCVLGPRVVGILAHEALGHAAEADLTASSHFHGKLGEKVASEIVTLVDAPIKGTFGAFKYDDEGVLMQEADIIKKGIFTGLLTNREYAHKTQMPLTGSARAENFFFPPLIRMRNTFFEKGDYTDEELFEGIKFGYYCKDFRGGEADISSSFQIGIQEAFEIENSEIGEPIKDLSVSGRAIEALFLIEGIGKESAFFGGYCGKGQEAAASAGGPHLRLKQGAILFGGRE
ncbi:MAG: TldD/PmbA family protein [Theionarchaea archaeon]|nr:TldD/PmbA family protein [Theionarchaea archaeon]